MKPFDKAEVAARLKRLRADRGLSLRELAARAGVAPSFLSKVENDKASPTIMSLSKILEGLGIDVATFFGWQRDARPDQVVYKRADMRPLKEVDRTWWYAFPDRPDIKMILTYEEFDPVTLVTTEDDHRTDLCGYVIEGTLIFDFPGRESARVEAGDAFYIHANDPHTARNAGPGPLRLVAVQIREG